MSQPAVLNVKRTRRKLSSPLPLLIINYVLILSSVISPTAGFLKHLSLNPLKQLIGLETCSPPSVRDAASAVAALQKSLDGNLFGQPLAKKTVITAIKMHWDEAEPKKAMVLSLHGWAGSGKTFTTHLVMKALFEKGDESKFVKFFSATYHFPDPGKVSEYRELLRREVVNTVKLCERALFVFDEVDKLPAGLLDVLVPLIKSVGRLEDGVNVKKAIFIFLSNSGATKINEITISAKEGGRGREELVLQDFEQVLSNDALESSGGLYKSELIDKILVDWFVPFLPLEREHVVSCIRRDAKNLGGGVGGFKNKALSMQDVEEIVGRLTFWPEESKLFSVTGCKRVENLVKFKMVAGESGYSNNYKREL